MAGGKRKGGAGGDFPLDNNFDKLAKVADDLRGRLSAFGRSVDAATRRLGGGAPAGGQPRPGGAGAAAAPVARVAPEDADHVRLLTREFGEKLDKAVAKASASINGLQRAVKGVGDIAGVLGFEKAAKGADALAKSLSAVRDVVGGLVAARGALLSIGVLAGTALGGIGLIQEAIAQSTGEMLSLENTIRATALALNRVGEQGIAGWRIAFNDLKAVGVQVLTLIGQKFLEVTGRGLQAFSEGIDALAEKVRNVPGLERLALQLDSISAGALGASSALRVAYDTLGENAAKSAAETQKANSSILAEMRAFVGGIDQEINKLFDEKDGASLFRDPAAALGGLAETIKRQLTAITGPSTEALKETDDALKKLIGTTAEMRQKLLGLQLAEAGSGFGRASIMTDLLDGEREKRLETIKVMEAQLQNLIAQGAAQTTILQIEEQLRQARQTNESLTNAENRDIFQRSQEAVSATTGYQSGVAYSSGVEQALADASPQINEQLVEMLTVDKNGEVINSFRDLLKNIGRLFRENPIGFLGGFLGLSGGAGAGLGGLSGTTAGAGGTPLAFAHGGKIPGGGRASPSHYLSPIGRAFGGAVDAVGAALARPAGLHPSDTVPLWGAVGEFMQPVSAVQRYGDSFMEAVRQGRFPVEVARAFAGGIRAPAPVRSSLPRGYAAGGSIGPVAGGGVAGAPTVLPVLAADGPTFERLLRGGRNELLKVLHEEGVSFNR
jgi:hypothetical protein